LVTVTSGGTGGEIIDQIAVGAIFKDEAPYLLEWLAFHKMIGVDMFYRNSPGSEEAIKPAGCL
jgi:hypothetical protein